MDLYTYKTPINNPNKLKGDYQKKKFKIYKYFKKTKLWK